MVKQILKRDGRIVDFSLNKIENAIYLAFESFGYYDRYLSYELAFKTYSALNAIYEGNTLPDVENIQDIVERTLIENGHIEIAKAYILYRQKRSFIREKKTSLMSTFRNLTFKDSKDNDLKRENANIDGDTPMGMMLRYGSESAKDFNERFLLKTEHYKAHKNGSIHIHDFDFYSLTTTCCQIDIIELFKNGFSTGHGFLREPNDIRSYSALAAIALQANQNDQHGGQSIPNFDYGMSLGVSKTFIKELCKVLEIIFIDEKLKDGQIESFKKDLTEYLKNNVSIMDERAVNFIKEKIKNNFIINRSKENIASLSLSVINRALRYTDESTFQAMEAFIHNLNTMHSRAGAQVPFSSINYGTSTTEEARMVIKNVLLATERGLGNGETPIFPIQIFKIKDGVNFNKGDKNYDMFKLACKVSALRLFPNFSFLDSHFNLKYYKPNMPETECAYMGCRTRVMSNIYDNAKETVYGRGNLSFTSVNLPRLAILSKRNLDIFFAMLENTVELVFNQLLDRFKIQSDKKVRNFPFLMGQGIWMDCGKLKDDDIIEDVLKHGTLSVGFIGLAECLKYLIGVHHGESEISQETGLKIIGFMREMTDMKSIESKLNFSLVATPAEGLSGRFLNIDKNEFGVIEGVTDRDYYTNSFHIPVYYDISVFKKIKIESPYHELTNGGHITYVEVDGDLNNNLEAFEDIIRYMKECGIGYGSINHPIDRDPVCGYTGVINDVCPRCGRREFEAFTSKYKV